MKTPHSTHSEVRQFRCDHPGCGKVFNRRDYLERHAMNHLDVKPYVCYQCSRSFSRKDLYDNHLTTKRHARLIQEAEMEASEHGIDSSISHPSQQQHLAARAASSAAPDVVPHTAYTWSKFRSPIDLQLPNSWNLPASTSYSHIHSSEPTRDPSDMRNLPDVRDHPDQLAHFTHISELDALSSGNPQSSSGYPQSATTSSLAGSDSMTAVEEGLNIGAVTDTLPYGSMFYKYDYSNHNYGYGIPPNSSYHFDYGHYLPQRPHLKRSHDSSASSSSSTLLEVGTRKSSVFTTSPGNSTTASCSGGTQQSVQDILDQDEVKNSELLLKLREVKQESKQQARVSGEDPIAPGQQLPDTNTQSRQLDLDGVSLDRGDFDKRYLWFFDDSFKSDRAKYGYDTYFGDTIMLYHDRTVQYEQAMNINPTNSVPKGARKHTIWLQTAQVVLQILSEVPESFCSDPAALVEEYIDLAWSEATAVSYIVHRPSYESNVAHPALLAVLTMLGMALSIHSSANEVAKAVYPNVFLYAYEALNADSQNTRYEALQIGHLQAFCILVRYERTILGDDVQRLSLTRYRSGRHIVDRFLWTALGSISHLELLPDSQWPQKPTRRLVWASVSQEGYVFHQGAEPDAQWREWAAYEMCKRTIFFAIYCDSIHSLSSSNRLGTSPVSVFNLDIHMICPDQLWEAPTHQQFFYLAGPSNLVSNVPYLGLLKSLFRFPRAATGHRHSVPTNSATHGGPGSTFGGTNSADEAESTSNSYDNISFDMRGGVAGPRSRPRSRSGATLSSEMSLLPKSEKKRESWSLLSLRMVAYGLITVVGRLLGLFSHQEAMLQAVISRNASPEALFGDRATWVSPCFERRIQARLYRGLDIWFQLFEQAYGNVTERLFKIAGQLGLKITEEFGPYGGVGDELEEGGVPEYALIVVLYHYSSFIFVHEDLPIVLQVTSNLPKWLGMDKQEAVSSTASAKGNSSDSESGKDSNIKSNSDSIESDDQPVVTEEQPVTDNESSSLLKCKEKVDTPVSLQTLLDYLYMPLYVQWIQTCEAKATVSTSALYLTWIEAATGRMSSKSSNHLFLSAVIYIAVIIIWLNDLAEHHVTSGKGVAQDLVPLELGKCAYMEQAVKYLYAVDVSVSEGTPLPQKRPLGAVMMLGAAMLNMRPNTEPLVAMLLQLVRVHEPSLSNEQLDQALVESREFYGYRQADSQKAQHQRPQRVSRETDTNFDANIDYEDVTMGVSPEGLGVSP